MTFRVLAIGVLAGAAASLAGSASADSASQGPQLRIVDRAPLTLKGQRFRAGEKVDIVVLQGKRKATRKAIAGPGGGFVVAVRGFGVSRCSDGLIVRARGNKGSRVSWELEQLHCQNPARSQTD